MKNRKHFLVSLLLVMCLVFAIGSACERRKDSGEEEVGGAQGVYYMDAEDGTEYTLSFDDNNFSLFLGSETMTGKYSLNDVEFRLSFNNDQTATGTLVDGVVTLTYNGATYVMLEKVTYTVTFNTGDAAAIAPVSVVNGRKVAAPQAPEMNGFIFIGWYTDATYKTAYKFDAMPVKGDVTLYARFVAEVESEEEFDVTYMVDGQVYATAQTTNGGVAYNSPVPEVEGKQFAGWWVSAYEDAEKLTYKYEEQVLQQDTVLYAVWKEGVQISVYEDEIVWTAQGANNNYKVVIKNAAGEEVDSKNTATAKYEFDFANYPAGDYVVTVTLNGKEYSAYYKNKALAKVSNFEVLEPALLMFNAVEGAEEYFITIDCGIENHNHTHLSLGANNYYDFSNCAMQPGGIIFVVYASKSGCTESVSDEFVYSKDLAQAENVKYNAATSMVQWDAVENAEGYTVVVENAGQTYTFNTAANVRYISVKAYTGDVVIKVTPVAKGWNSPEAAQISYFNEKLAAPQNVQLQGNVLTWDAVEGAVSYIVKIDNATFAATENQFTITEEQCDGSYDTYKIEVQAVSATASKSSAYSDAITVRYDTMADSLTYAAGYVEWEYVLAAAEYGVKVNNGSVVKYPANVNKAAIELTKSGVNTISVCCYDANGVASAWVDVEVFAYAIRFDTDGGYGINPLYKAVGDPYVLPDAESIGFTFDAWYDMIDGAENNANVYAKEGVLEAEGDMIVYAGWIPNPYKAILVVDEGGEPLTETEVVVYFDGAYKLPVPQAKDVTKAFGGWFTEPNAQGFRYTDANGNSMAVWRDAHDRQLYSSWIDVLTYELIDGGTAYGVKGIKDLSVNLTTIHVPHEYKGLPVTTVMANAFKSTRGIRTIELPDTLENINIGATGGNGTDSPFQYCYDLENVNVYCIDPENHNRHEAFFSSHDGALIYHNPMTGQVELKYIPYARTGSFKIPYGVTNIPVRALYNVAITEIYIPASVARIEKEAFYSADVVKVIFTEPEEGQTAAELSIGEKAFSSCSALTSVTFPSRLNEFDTTAFNSCSALTELLVADTSGRYFSEAGLLCEVVDGVRTIAYAPKAYIGDKGTFTVPSGITAIGKGAFESCTSLASVVIPAWVTRIGENAFKSCSHISSLTFLGTAEDLPINIEASAFYGNTDLTSLTLPANTGKVSSHAFGNTQYLYTVNLDCGAGVEFEPAAFGTTAATPVYYITELTIGPNVPAFPVTEAFGAEKLVKINVDPANANYTSIDGILFNKEATEIIFFPAAWVGEYTIPSGVTSIGNMLFKNRDSLTKITIPASVTNIGDEAFASCGVLKEVVFLEPAEGEEAKELVIGTKAFNGLTVIETITFPERTKSLGSMAVSACGKLLEINLPSTLTQVYVETFDADGVLQGVDTFRCASLKNINVAAGNPVYGSKDGILYEKDENGKLATLLYCPQENFGVNGTLDIPKEVSRLYSEAFYNNEGLVKIIFSEGIEGDLTIDANVFYFVDTIEQIDLPSGLTRIEESTFYYCRGLETITIPNTVSFIGKEAFYYCTSLTNVIFEEGNDENTLTLENGDRYYQDHYGGDASYYGVFYSCDAMTSIVLPERTVHVGDYAFANMDNLTSIYIPANVTYLGKRAFAYDRKLSQVTFGENSKLTTLGFGAFYYCKALEYIDLPGVEIIDYYTFNNSGLKSIVLQEGLKKIGHYAFAYTNITEITIPASVEEFDDTTKSDAGTNYNYGYCWAFYSCKYLEKVTFAEGSKVKEIMEDNFYNLTALKSINLPEGLEIIGERSFYNTAIEEITIPSTVKEIRLNAFSGCKQLKKVTFAEGGNLELIGENAFLGTSITEFTFPTNTDSTVKISLGATIFKGCSELTKVHISKSVVNIDSVFAGCSALTQVTIDPDNENFMQPAGGDPIILNKAGNAILLIYGEVANGTYIIPDGYEYIGARAFEGIGSLKKLIIPASIREIGEYAFANTGLEEVTFIQGEGNPSQLTTIGEGAFQNTYNLKSIAIPDGVTVIEAYTFDTSAVSQLTLPANLTTINKYAFENCTNLTSLTFPETLTVIEDYAFRYCGLEEVILPDSITHLGIYCFSELPNLVTVRYPLGLTSSDNRVFDDNKKLKNVILPEGLTKIFNYTFYDCVAIEEIVLPSSLTELGDYVFYNCSSLKKINTENVTKFGASVFYKCVDLTELAFSNAITKIGGSAFRYSGLTEININAPKVDLSGTYTFGDMPNLTKITIGEGPTKLGNYSFQKNPNLVEVNLPNSLTYLGTNAFIECTALKEFTVPTGITCFGTSATSCAIGNSTNVFKGCTALEKVVFHEKFTKMAGYVFSGCTSLKTLENTAQITLIGNYCFQNCTSLTSFDMSGVSNYANLGTNVFRGCESFTDVKLNDSLTQLKSYTFAGCTSLKSITLPSKLTKFNTYCFMESGIESIVMPAGVTAIDNYVFQNCKSLASVDLVNVKTIGTSAFNGCSALTSITLPASVTSIGGSAFLNSGLTAVNIPAKVATITSNNPFAGSPITAYTVDAANTKFMAVEGVLCTKDGTILAYPSKKGGDVVIPEGATIGSYAFNGASGITSITLPATMKVIPQYSFYGLACSPTFNFLGEVNEIDSYAFQYADIESITIPETVRTIDNYAFRYTEKLKSIKLPDKLNVLGSYAFADSAIESIEIPGTVQRLVASTTSSVSTSSTAYTFSNCVNLKEVILNEGLQYIGASAFRDCVSLESIVIPSTVKIVGNYAFEASGIKEVTWNTVETPEIGTYLFQNCTNLAKATFPAGLTAVPNYMFDGCTAVTEIEWQDTITEVGNYAFSATAVENLVLPAHVTTYGTYVFTKSAVKEVTLSSNPATTYGNYMFQDSASLEKVIIPNGATQLSGYMFKNCTLLSEVNFPASLSTFGTYIFENTGFTTITIPGTIKAMPNYMFQKSTKLETVIIEEGVEEIGMYAFAYCTALTSVSLPESLMSMGTCTFGYMSNMKKIIIPAECSVGLNCFRDWKSDSTVYARGSSATVSALWNASWRAYSECNLVTDYTGE